MLRTLIIDDEEIARLRLHKLIGQNNTLEVIDEAVNGIEAIEKIDQLKPDLIFLDIQMPGYTGFDVLKRITHIPSIIFTTAYDEFALKAFDENALAYLLKPIDKTKLGAAIDRASQINSTKKQNIIEVIESIPKKNLTLFLSKIGSRIKFVRSEDVCFIDSKDKHTFIHTTESKEYIIDYTLTDLESLLGDEFIRIHRSAYLNISHISEAEKMGEGKFLFTVKDRLSSQIQSSTSYLSAIKNVLGI